MRRASLVLALACIGGVAFAQLPNDGRFIPQWDQRPNAYDFAGNYPPTALENDIPGIVQLCCSPREDRRLDCRVGYEWPENRHFGEASLTIARRFRMSRESYAAYQADSNAWMQLPIRWNAPSDSEIAQRISEATRNLCNPNAASAAPAPAP